MGEKFGQNRHTVSGRMDELSKDALRVVLTGAVSGVCRDAKDDFILECAVVGGAELIVTGDKDLLSLGSYRDTRVVAPRQYLDDAGGRARSQ